MGNFLHDLDPGMIFFYQTCSSENEMVEDKRFQQLTPIRYCPYPVTVAGTFPSTGTSVVGNGIG